MSTNRDNDLKHLHPLLRERIDKLLARLKDEGLPFRNFECFRSPQRQQYLFEQGRTRPGGIVTNARPWTSYHQFGCAADFVLFENGQWSWDDSGKKSKWWKRLQELGVEVGLEYLSWEKPHLQLRNLSAGSLMAGKYPAGGDSDWAENLEAAIYSWTGRPQSPPVPEIIEDRPGLAGDVVEGVDISGSPAPGAADWHSQFEGQEWRYDREGIYLRGYENGQAPLRTPGEPVTCRKIMELCGKAISKASQKYQVPMAIIIMTIATETGSLRNYGFTGPYTFRWESQVKVTDVSPSLLGDYSIGPMQTLATTARWVIREQRLEYDPFTVAPVYEFRPEPPDEHPLYDYEKNIDIGTAEIKQRWPVTGDDPVLVAAAFNAGGLYKSAQNPWRLRTYGSHLDRATKWYGDACAVLKQLGS